MYTSSSLSKKVTKNSFLCITCFSSLLKKTRKHNINKYLFIFYILSLLQLMIQNCALIFFLLKSCLSTLIAPVWVLKTLCFSTIYDSSYRLYAISFENMLIGRMFWWRGHFCGGLKRLRSLYCRMCRDILSLR